MNFFWVNIGSSYKEVLAGSFLWAPSYSVGGKGQHLSNAGWNTVPMVKKGDVIFCHRSGFIISVAVATKDAYTSDRPKTRAFDGWQTEGNRIDLEITLPAVPVDISSFKSTLINIHNKYCQPVLFTVTGKIAQQYMIALPQGAGALIMSYLGEDEVEIEAASAGAGKKKLVKGGKRVVVTSARIGQGQFREDVLSLWKNKCPVTGITKSDLLVASHVVPWGLSSDEEKIDPDNGFPFSPAVDKLFDRGYISFDDSGKMIVQPSLNAAELLSLGLTQPIRVLPLNKKQRQYLARHRALYHF